MKKLLQSLSIAVLAIPTFAFAQNQATQTTTLDKVQAAQGVPTVQATVKNQTTTLVSPRTGVRYVLGETGNRPIIFKASQITPANSSNINRIVANNPALSATSQEKAKQALLAVPDQVSQTATPATTN